jgi:hypothetical protein
MQIKERIDTCLTALEQKRQAVSAFQAKLQSLIESLKTKGMTPGTLAELLATLESVVKDYAEIGASCQQMVEGLKDIGDHMTHIEDGRQKILDGVEAILKNLSHLDRLAKNGMQVGTTTGSGKSPKRILLVRITPQAPAGSPGLEAEDDEDDPSGTVLH